MALLGVGCGSDRAESSELALDGTNVSMRYDPAFPPCPGSVKFLDDVAQRQAQYLGYAVGPKIPYHFAEALASTPCGSAVEAGGCTLSGSIWATFPDLTHELVHAILIPQKGISVSFFEEGVAVALGGSDTSGADYSAGMETLFSADPLPRGQYATAGDFVSYLLTTYGADKLRALFPSVPRKTSPSDVDAALARVYGKGFEALVAERQASGLVLDEARLALPECGGATLPWTDGLPTPSLHYDVTPACDGDGIGYAKDGSRGTADVWHYAAFDVPKDGLYRLSMNASGGGDVRFRQCLTGEELPISAQPKATTTDSLQGQNLETLVTLRQGRHYFQTVGPVASPTTFHFTLDAVPAPTPASCTTPETIPADADGYYLAPRLPSPAGDVTMSVKVDAPRRALVVLADADLRICTACTASCTSAPLSAQLELQPGSTYTLTADAQKPRGWAGFAFSF